jgi:hypothetical protein
MGAFVPVSDASVNINPYFTGTPKTKGQGKCLYVTICFRVEVERAVLGDREGR